MICVNAIPEPNSPTSPVGKISTPATQRRWACRGRRQRPLSTEVELKLVAPAAELEKLERAILAMPTVRSEARSDLVSTYYDTSTRALHGSRLTLRVRTVGEKVP